MGEDKRNQGSRRQPASKRDEAPRPKAKLIRAFAKKRAGGLGRRLNPVVGRDESGHAIRAGDNQTLIGHLFATIGQALRLVARAGGDEAVPDIDEQRRRYRALASELGVADVVTRTRVCRNLRIEVAVFFGVGLYGIYLVISGFATEAATVIHLVSQIGLGAMVTVFAVTRIAQGLWRLDVIRHRRWLSFWHWLRRGMA